MLKAVRDQVVRLARQVNHDQVPALYDQSIGEFYFVPGGQAPRVETEATRATDALHVQTAGELEQSFWNRIKDSTDPTDFSDYEQQFPKGPHSAEAALLRRKLARSAHSGDESAPRKAVAATTSERPARAAAPAAGAYAGYVTSSLQPGTMLRGRLVLESSGDFEYTGSNKVKVRGSLDLSAPGNVTGTATVTQPKVLGLALMTYPDGSTSARMVIRGQIVEGVLRGRYSDAYETGELVFDLNNPL